MDQNKTPANEGHAVQAQAHKARIADLLTETSEDWDDLDTAYVIESHAKAYRLNLIAANTGHRADELRAIKATNISTDKES